MMRLEDMSRLQRRAVPLDMQDELPGGQDFSKADRDRIRRNAHMFTDEDYASALACDLAEMTPANDRDE